MYSKSVISRLQNLQTPFYLYDMNLLRDTLKAASGGASRFGYRLHYAVKANFDRKVMSTIKDFGIGADCVSGPEVEYAIACGFAPSSIVFAGVGKTDRELECAINAGIASLNCESLEELEVVDGLCGKLGKVQNVSIRINPDVDPKTHKCISTGQADSKFGVSYESTLQCAEKILSLKNISITGLHLHVGSQIRDMEVFRELCVKVNDIVSGLEEKGFRFESIDLGGGLGIDYLNPESEPVPQFEAVYRTVSETLEAGGRSVHFEFGRSIVAQCGELITRVLFNKTTATGRKLLIVDASMTELIRPALYGSYHSIENLTDRNAGTDIYTVVGTVCESTDVFCKDRELAVSRRGDLLTIKSAGAYGMSMASRYNLHELPSAVYSDDII